MKVNEIQISNKCPKEMREFIELIWNERKRANELYKKAVQRNDAWESSFQSGKATLCADLILKLEPILRKTNKL